MKIIKPQASSSLYGHQSSHGIGPGSDPWKTAPWPHSGGSTYTPSLAMLEEQAIAEFCQGDRVCKEVLRHLLKPSPSSRRPWNGQTPWGSGSVYGLGQTSSVPLAPKLSATELLTKMEEARAIKHRTAWVGYGERLVRQLNGEIRPKIREQIIRGLTVEVREFSRTARQPYHYSYLGGIVLSSHTFIANPALLDQLLGQVKVGEPGAVALHDVVVKHDLVALEDAAFPNGRFVKDTVDTQGQPRVARRDSWFVWHAPLANLAEGLGTYAPSQAKRDEALQLMMRMASHAGWHDSDAVYAAMAQAAKPGDAELTSFLANRITSPWMTHNSVERQAAQAQGYNGAHVRTHIAAALAATGPDQVPALVAILDDAETIPESWNPQQLRAKERFTATVVSRALAGTEEGREALARRLGVRDPWSFAEVALVSDGFDAIPALLSVYTGTMLDPQTNAAIVNILGALPDQLETTGRLSIARGVASLLRSDDSKVRAIALTILEQKPSIMDDSAVVQTQIRRMADGLEEVTGAEKTSASTLLEKRQAQRMKVAKELSRRQRYGPLDPLDSLKTSDAELRWLNKYLHGQTQHYLQPRSIPDPWGLSYQHYLNGL